MASLTYDPEEMELRDSVVDLVCAQYITRCVYVMCKLNVPDLLKSGPKSSQELALLTSTHEPYLLRILRVSAASGGIFRQDGNTFTLTPKGNFLTKDHPHSLRSFCLKSGHEVFNRTLDELEAQVIRGQVGIEIVYNKSRYIPFFEELGIGGLFAESMQGYSSMHVDPTAKALKIRPGENSVVDIAGGTGTFLSAVLRAHPDIKTGVLFDVPLTIEKAQLPGTPISELLKEGRVALQPGDMFVPDSFPVGRDVYLLQHVISDYTDEQSSMLLSYIFRAMKGSPKGSRFLLVDLIPTDKHGYAHTLDVILMLKGGTMRTLEELTVLLTKAGFKVPEVTQVPGIHDKFILSTTIRDDAK